MQQQHVKYCLVILVMSLLASCVRDKPQTPLKTSVTINTDHKVLITNEGNFGWGEGTISLYDPISKTVVENYYSQQNNSAALGNICQSITKYNNSYYIVMNNSNKIVVVNTGNFIKTNVISGFNSPRYLLPISYHKAYVSDLYANSIQVVDLNTATITGSVACFNGTEEMALVYDKAFITNPNSGYCYVMNTSTDIIVDSLYIGEGVSSIVVDRYSKLWVLANGSSTGNQSGRLIRFNPITLNIEQQFMFTSHQSRNKLCINKTRDTLYYLNNGVYQQPIKSTSLPASPLIPQGNKRYYGLGLNPIDYSIYVADAIDFVQKSKIEIYNPNGNFITGFNAGIISNGFMFE